MLLSPNHSPASGHLTNQQKLTVFSKTRIVIRVERGGRFGKSTDRHICKRASLLDLWTVVLYAK